MGSVGVVRPGGRAARVRTAVLEAAFAELVAGGWDSFSVDAVALRSGVHKTTIYRRWRTPEDLALDAVAEHASTSVPIPDTGSLAGDLQALARAIGVQLGSDPGRALARLAAGAGPGSPLAQLRTTFFEDRYRLAEDIVRRAVSRKEAAPSTDANAVARTVSGLLLARVLVNDDPVSPAESDQAAAVVLAAIAAGALRRRRRS